MWAGPAASFVPNMLLASEDIKQKQNERKNEPLKVPGEIKRSQRREVELDLQVSPEEIMNREVDFLRFELFVNSSATDIVFVTLPKHSS